MNGNIFVNQDCIEYMQSMKDNSVDCTLTDIPYNGVNMSDNGLRKLSRGKADVLTFPIQMF